MEILYKRFTPGQQNLMRFYEEKRISAYDAAYARNLLFVCPKCGTSWGSRVFIDHTYEGDGHHWEVRTVPCDLHGEASLITAWDIIDDFLFIPDDLLIYEARRLLALE